MCLITMKLQFLFYYKNFIQIDMIGKQYSFLSLVLLIFSSLLLVQIHGWCLKETFAQTDKIKSIDFSPDGSKFVTTSNSKNVIIWDAHSLAQLYVYNIGVTVNNAKFSKDGVMLAIGFSQNNLVILNANTYALISNSINTNHGVVYQVDFNWNTTYFVTCGSDNRVRTWNVSGTSITYYQNQDEGSDVLACRLARNTARVARGTSSSKCILDNYWYNSSTASSNTKSGQIDAIAWNDNTNRVMFGSTNKKLNYQATNGSIISFFNQYTVPCQVFTISITQDGDYMMFGGDDSKIYIYDMSVEGSQFLTETLLESSNDITASDFSDDNQYLLVGNSDGMLYMYKRMCKACSAGTYANLSVCTPCSKAISGCYLCDNSSQCRACSNGYFLNSNNGCDTCVQSMTGCNLCNSSGICTSCIQKYYLDTGSNSCKTCWSISTGCNACNSSNYCFSCDYRYYLNSSSNLCVSCTNITKCLACNSSVYCLQCVQGYYQDGSGGCTQCNSNCTMCTNGSYCTQCDNGFYLSAGVCSPCTVKGCLSCNSTNYCFDCLQSMYTNAGGCSFCAPPCSQCQTTAATCLSCIGGYYLSGTSCLTCTAITTGCLTCNGSTSTKCLSCQVGYYLNSTNGCTQCNSLLLNCASCTNTSCIVCKIGYYYNTTNSDCQICQKGCFTCTSYAVCQSCQVGYYFTSATNTCSLCPTPCSACNSSAICTSCNPKYYFNSTNNNCTLCGVTNCNLCTSQSVCTNCFEGYFVDSAGALCRSCSVNITNCLSCYNQSYCKSCALGFYLTATNSACTQCSSPCSACNSTDCHNCQLGYYLTTVAPKTCVICPLACSFCVSATNCSSCVTGYYLNSVTNVCISCSTITTGCSKCNNTTCLDCQAQLGYYYISGTSTCGSCTTVISKCVFCFNSTICNLCEYGYFLATSNTSCQSCSSSVNNCQDCATSTTCKTCMKGFYADGSGNCQICMQGCFSCNSSNYCQICVRDYVLETNNTCTICQTKLQGCQMCKYNPTIQCTNCLTGYYLVGTVCSLCSSSMSGCSICNTSAICVNCLAQYFMFTDNLCHLCSNNITSCQLCVYDTVNSILNCTECNEGFFLNSSNLCQTCSIVGCLGCTNSATCTRCQTNYYLNGITCTQCQTTYTGCLLCNNTVCIQCQSGFYLSGGTCHACNQVGCQVCSQTNPTTKCLSCNSEYYLTSTSTCQTCSTPLPNCVICSTALACQQCQSGYYIAAGGTCSLCSSQFPGCIMCNPTNCIQCDSGYLLNSSNLCQLCNSYMPGCSFCLSTTSCIACESGYYMNSGSTCSLCSDIQGCLQCQNSTSCIFCDYGYYINNGTCDLCNQTINNCVACISPTMCTACQGNFDLSGGSCTQIQGLAIASYENIKFITQYVSDTQLKSSLLSIGAKIYQIQLNWTALTKLYILDKAFTKYPLAIHSWQFGADGYSLIFHTDNPLGNSDIFNSLSDMPFLSRRLLMTQNQEQKRLLQSSFTGTLNSQIQMTESGINSLFPTIHHTGSFYTLYNLQSPQFYKSILKSKSYNYHYFGITISILLVIIYYIKSIIVVPESNDKGQIIPHILCVKIIGLILYPIYGEQLDYCYGFMVLDFPWLNDFFANYMSVLTDVTPSTYFMYYSSMSIASTYLLALIIVFFVYMIFYLYFKVIHESEEDWSSFQSYFYNLFIVGLLVSSFASLLGAYYNSIQDISINSIFYILGISIYIGLLLQTAYSLYNFKKYMPFHKPRIIFKITLMCLAYKNPLYIFMAMMFLQICMLIIQFIIKKETLVRPKTWLCNNLLADVALGLMMLGPQSLLFLYGGSICIILVIIIDLYIQFKEYSQFQQINKVRIRQKQLVKTMQSFQYQNKQARMKNDQIYFKNKVMQELSVTNENITNNQTKNDFYKTNKSLLFNDEESDVNSNFFQTLTPLDSISPDKHRLNRRKTKTDEKTLPKGPSFLLNPRKKTDDQMLIQDNQETFILGQL